MAADRRATLWEQAAAQVRQWLRDGTLRRGEFYSVQQVADRLGMSRSPVREGLLSLAEAGLIRFSRNRGFKIVVPTGHDIAQIFALRLALEPPAARRAAATADARAIARVDDAFRQMLVAAGAGDPREFADLDQGLHSVVMAAGGNARATAIVDALRDATRALGPSTAGRSRTLADIAGDHEAFLDGIRRRDPARAHMAMRQHLMTTGRLLIQQCHQDGDEHAWQAWDELIDDDV